MDYVNIINRCKDWFLYWNLTRLLQDSKSILDLGCGGYSPIKNITKHFYSIGVDIFSPSIKASKAQHIHDIYIKCNLLDVYKHVKSKSVDTVLILDVIEHFSKKDAYTLLSIAEKIARVNVIVLTPNGFWRQDQYANNPYQVHKSGWSTKDLQKIGYTVYGLRGYKQFRGEYASIVRKPWIFWAALSFISEPILYVFPSMSYHLFAVKHITK